MRVCAICGKGSAKGRNITYRGKLKKRGGVGRKTVRSSLRRFLPNLQPMTVMMNGSVKRVRVCTACLRSGKVQRAPRRSSAPAR